MHPFTIEDDILTCLKCNSSHSLEYNGESYDHCSCWNIRIIRCKLELHITCNAEKTDIWYEYSKITKRLKK